MESQANKTTCNGNCQACSFQQRVYCAAYMARNNYAMIEALLDKIDVLQERINAIQAEGTLISPLQEEIKEETIEVGKKGTIGASGAENRLLKQSTIS